MSVARIATLALLAEPFNGKRQSFWLERVRLPKFDRYYDAEVL